MRTKDQRAQGRSRPESEACLYRPEYAGTLFAKGTSMSSNNLVHEVRNLPAKHHRHKLNDHMGKTVANYYPVLKICYWFGGDGSEDAPFGYYYKSVPYASDDVRCTGPFRSRLLAILHCEEMYEIEPERRVCFATSQVPLVYEGLVTRLLTTKPFIDTPAGNFRLW